MSTKCSISTTSYKNTTRIDKLGSAKLLQTNTHSSRVAEIFTPSKRWLNESVTLSCLLYFLKQQTCVQEKTTSMQLFSLIVSLTIVVVIASGRCPSKSLQIGMPGKLIDSLLFHTFTLQCSLPFPPLFRSLVTSGEWRQLFQAFNSTGMKEL